MNRNQENVCVCVCAYATQSEFEFNKHEKWSLSGGRDKLSESILGGRSQTTAPPLNILNPGKDGLREGTDEEEGLDFFFLDFHQ